jgi:hypothetical protein
VLRAIERHRPDVFFPIEARVIDADDAWLSPFHGRVSGSIAVHAYYKDDHRFFFDLIEPIFRRFGGSAPLGQDAQPEGRGLRCAVPEVRRGAARSARRRSAGRMLNEHLREVFGS